ncbi:branched-chain amino acid ABC transporter permease [Geodermatophilus sp. Leaf369]|uniref:branched-chain amino acid ABC transporter permease n=1 Tax=Geodermatophilus sp. Leaf369 TaxID=1736354 RepID=UPI000AA521DF|nr:branched-chain amino acid ABC transporter permease [Geodermatophilus sp. Leaf369]
MTALENRPAERATPAPAKGRRPWGRPAMYTGYGQDMALLNTGAKKAALAVLLVVALLLPFVLEDELLRLLATGAVLAIGAIGLNLVTGYAGQVSLGHAFFLGIGAYTAAVVSGETGDEDLYGFGITFIPVWLLAGGAMAALVGLVVAPLASRLRGLYLAIVTLGLVFLGEHVFREWDAVTGGVGVGRPAADPVLFGVDLSRSTDAFSADQQMYLLMTALLVLFALLGRNIARSAIGRSFAAVRDRDIAAEVTGVDVRKAKRLAFVISGFYAGCAGALLYSISGYLDPSSFGLLVSVQFVAMVLIGGVATISGSIMGAFFIAILPRLTRELPEYLPFLSSSATEFPNVFQVETLLYGLLIVAFLIFEPRGLFGVWVRARNYWKSWPFSY